MTATLLKQFVVLVSLIFTVFNSFAQFDYTSTLENPFGKANPEAPREIQDYAQIIGCSKCISISRKLGGEWEDPVKMTWTFKYIMNGMAVQDETLKEDGIHSGSIRLFDNESKLWLVHYYSLGSLTQNLLRMWSGGHIGDHIVLHRKQQAPNGLEGFYRITFYEISDTAFKWLGEWVSKDNTIIYPAWKISCEKIK